MSRLHKIIPSLFFVLCVSLPILAQEQEAIPCPAVEEVAQQMQKLPESNQKTLITPLLEKLQAVQKSYQKAGNERCEGNALGNIGNLF